MAIEIKEFANVSISVSPSGVAGGNFGILGFLTNEEGTIGAAERARAYTSLASVLEDWSATSEVGKAATAYYAATPTPTDFVVLMCFESDQAATLTGGGHEDLETLKAISAGSLTITNDVGEAEVTDLDLTSATSLEDVATTLETAINAVTVGAVTVSHTGYGFEVKTVSAGTAASLTFATGDDAESLGLQQHQGKLSTGFAAETPVVAIGEAVAKGIDFTAIVTHKKYRDQTGGSVGTSTLEIAQFAEAAKKIFCNTSNDLAVLSADITSDVISQCKDSTLRFTLSTFSKNVNQYPSAAVFGRSAAVNFSAVDSTITLNLKQIPTITAEDLSPNEFAVLRSKHGSAVCKIGKTTNAYTDSRMASGSWLDTTHGLLWLENRCETDLFNLLYQSPTKIPFTQDGINTIVATLERSLLAAVRNGLATSGFLPDGTFLPEGYRINSVKLADVPASDKSNRLYAGLSFDMVGAGAFHEVEVTGNFAE